MSAHSQTSSKELHQRRVGASYLLSFELLPLADELQQQAGPLQVVPQAVPLRQLLLQLLAALQAELLQSQTHRVTTRSLPDPWTWVRTD